MGPGGGQVGPKPVVQSSNYAEAKDIREQFNNPATSNLPQSMGAYRPPSTQRSVKPRNSHVEEQKSLGEDNGVWIDKQEQMV